MRNLINCLVSLETLPLHGLIIFRYNWKDSWHLEETDDHWKRLLTAGRVSWQLEETAWIDEEYFTMGQTIDSFGKTAIFFLWLLDPRKNQSSGLGPRVLGVVREQRPNPATKLSPRLTVTFDPNGEPSGSKSRRQMLNWLLRWLLVPWWVIRMRQT